MPIFTNQFQIFSREFLVGVPPPLYKAVQNYNVADRLKINQNDVIAIIDGRAELQFMKGQNQTSFEIGTFPRYVQLVDIGKYF